MFSRLFGKFSQQEEPTNNNNNEPRDNVLNSNDKFNNNINKNNHSNSNSNSNSTNSTNNKNKNKNNPSYSGGKDNTKRSRVSPHKQEQQSDSRTKRSSSSSSSTTGSKQVKRRNSRNTPSTTTLGAQKQHEQYSEKSTRDYNFEKNSNTTISTQHKPSHSRDTYSESQRKSLPKEEIIQPDQSRKKSTKNDQLKNEPQMDLSSLSLVKTYNEFTQLCLDKHHRLVMITISSNRKYIQQMKQQSEILQELRDQSHSHNHHIVEILQDLEFPFSQLSSTAASVFPNKNNNYEELTVYAMLFNVFNTSSVSQFSDRSHIITLRDIIDSHQRTLEEDAIKYMKQMCEALKHIQDFDVLHLNIDPTHIFIDEKNKLISLGGFLCAQQRGREDNNLLLSDLSPLYRPPEIFDESSRSNVMDTSVDIWSMSAVCFEMISKERVVWSANLLQNEEYFNIDCFSVREQYPHLFSVLGHCLVLQPHLRSSLVNVINALSRQNGGSTSARAHSTILDSLTTTDHFRDDRNEITKSIRSHLLQYASKQRRIGNLAECIALLLSALDLGEDTQIRMQLTQDCHRCAEQLYQKGDQQRALRILENAVPTPEIRELQKQINSSN